MSREAMAWAKLAADMTRAAKRRADESDSEDSIDQLTNRGNKLKRKARFVQEGQLAVPNGPEVYQKTVTFYHEAHDGIVESFERDTISSIPKLYDDNGYEVDQDDEHDSETALRFSDLYPYSNVRIEDVFAPLGAAEDLKGHPTLSRPFTSKTLTELSRHAADMMQKEKAALWRMRQLLTKLSGDYTWIPCETLETEDDYKLFEADHASFPNQPSATQMPSHGHVGQGISSTLAPSTNHKIVNGEHENASQGETTTSTQGLANSSTITATVLDEPRARSLSGTRLPQALAVKPVSDPVPPRDLETPNSGTKEALSPMGSVNKAADLSQDGVDEHVSLDSSMREDDLQLVRGSEIVSDVDEAEGAFIPHRMRTRAKAHAFDNSELGPRSATPDSGASFVHPMFLVPQPALPDRDYGLPQQEAEETRRLVQLYIQKQEQICRGTEELYMGLLKADRLRHMVMSWAKAEGHTQESGNGLSDGEDWYDLEEWGLSEDLKKGQDEEEEDAATTAKKTRTRRQ